MPGTGSALSLAAKMLVQHPGGVSSHLKTQWR
jgi:hypothetical protein